MKAILIVTGLALLGASAMAATTIDAVNQHAYGADIGWLNARGDVTNGAVIANLAKGRAAHAVQNIASNDSCDPPPTVCVGVACGQYRVAGNP